MPKTKATFYCYRCGRKIRAFDIFNFGGKPRAVCKGGCPEEKK